MVIFIIPMMIIFMQRHPTEQAIVQTEFRMTPLTGTMKSVSVRTGSIMKSMMASDGLEVPARFVTAWRSASF